MDAGLAPATLMSKLRTLNYTAAAFGGGFVAAQALSYALIPVLMAALTQPLADAVYLASMADYLIYFILIIAGFCQPSANRAWGLNLALTLLGAGTYYLLMRMS